MLAELAGAKTPNIIAIKVTVVHEKQRWQNYCFLKLESQGRISVKEIDGANEQSSKLLTILQHLKKSS